MRNEDEKENEKEKEKEKEKEHEESMNERERRCSIPVEPPFARARPSNDRSSLDDFHTERSWGGGGW